MIIRVLLAVSILGFVLAQDDRIINVKQIMRDTFDILKNLPPPSNLNQVSKVMFPTTTLSPVYYNNNNNNNAASVPQLTPDEYQALLAARSNRPLTIQQRSVLFNLNQKINAQKQYTQSQGVQYNNNQYYQRAPQNQQQQPPIMNPINRIFATPTEKDMERLLRLPADILYKIAEEGHYIDPEDDSQGYSHAKTMSEVDRPLPAGVSSSDSSNPGLFGNGFSFNVGNDNAGQITNPFLTKEDVKKENSTPQQKTQQESTTPSKVEEQTKTESQTPAKEITYQNAGDKVDKTKPYFVVNNGEWQLVVPQPDDKPALQIPVKDFTKLTEAVARASARSGMPVDMAKMVAAEELHVKAAEATTASSVQVSTTATATEASKKIEKTPASAFIQESESLKSEEEEKAPISTPKTTADEEVITLNGKVYRLVKEEKPKKKKTKKTKKSQTTGQNSTSHVSSTVAPSTTTHVPMPQTTAPQVAAGVPLVSPLSTVHYPGVNQPIMPSMLSQYQPQQLTYEQQQILAELQQRYLQSQAMLTQQQSNGQTPYVQTYNAPQPQTAAAISAAAQQMSQPYYQKVSAPATLPQIPTVTAQMPVKIQHYPSQAVVSKAAAAPIKVIKETPHHIDPNQSSLPKQKIYSLQELDQFYNMQNSEVTTEASLIKETTTEKVYAPHKQIKIKMNSNNDNQESADENEQVSKTTVVDATADAIDEEKKRIAELRRKFNLERQQLSKRNRARFEKTTNLEPTTPPSFTITEQHCYNIKNFAKQAGSSNVYEYAVSHCHYIENYYPDLTCANVDDYIKVCQRYYSTRRMLFS